MSKGPWQVEGPEMGSATLKAPLTGRSCVLHSAAVPGGLGATASAWLRGPLGQVRSKQLHDGMPSVPVAFSASSVDFMVTLVDDKETCLGPQASVALCESRGIHIKGEEVSLFDMVNGKCIEQTTFDAAPDSWQAADLSDILDSCQDFVMTHRAAPPQGLKGSKKTSRARGAEWSTSSSLRPDA